MPPDKTPHDYQSLYPEAQKVSGMSARKPTHFSVPILKTFILLALPLYAAVAVPSLYVYFGGKSRDAIATESIALFAGVALIFLIGVVMVLAARTIIVRNCSRPSVIELLYVGLGIPLAYATVYYAPALGRLVPTNLLTIQAVIIGAFVLAVVLLARLFSR